MATFTITTPVNIDSLASKAGSDTYNINGGARITFKYDHQESVTSADIEPNK